MNGRERILAAMQRQPTDRIPRGELLIDAGFAEDFFRCYELPADFSSQDKMAAIYHVLAPDLVCLPYHEFDDDQPSDEEQACSVDQFRKDCFFVFCLIDGAFESAMKATGFMEFHRQLLRKPEETAELIRTCSETVIEQIKISAGKGADGIMLGEDIAYQQNLYVSPDWITKRLTPYWNKQVKLAHAMDLPVFFHSDGNINAALPVIAETGFDGLQCIEAGAGMDIGKVKKEYGDRLCLMGNLDPALLIESKDQNDSFYNLTTAVESLIADAAEGGGFIFGTSSGLYTGLSPRKVKYVYELLEKAKR